MRKGSHKKYAMLNAVRVDNLVTVDAIGFVELVKNKKPDIESVSFAPPKIGGKGFGSFNVRMKTRYYEAS